ncbi:MAG TPA: sigma 54-interacting transcriptional regulator [Polyangiaceae bacterium]|nr:sigma 54-interacting transcriptional regulator [Polyangiaceae bacterium]
MESITTTIGDALEVSRGSIVVVSSERGEPGAAPVRIGPDPCLVGRGHHCHVRLDDPRVSTSHCALVATEHGVRLTDLGSRNGTLVNQVLLERGSSVLLAGDARIRCGQTWLAVQSAGRSPVAVASDPRLGPMVGGSLAMRRVYAQVASAAAHELSVLVTGETGTGKELVARAIHDGSRRRGGPFVTVDCTTIPGPLAESLLFGHEKGAFTGAVGRGLSPFLTATGGTIFFDELGELPLDVQPKLLRALEARVVQSVGSARQVPIDVRVIAATRRDLHTEMNARRFRDDLYYRFAQVVIEMPPLRAHIEDVPAMIRRFVDELGDPGAMARIDEASLARLMRCDWPGNVRQLRNAVLVAHAESNGGPIAFSEVTGRAVADRGNMAAGQPFHVLKRDLLSALELQYFVRLHTETTGNVSEMARRSGLSRPMVRRYLQRLGLRMADPNETAAPGGGNHGSTP